MNHFAANGIAVDRTHKRLYVAAMQAKKLVFDKTPAKAAMPVNPFALIAPARHAACPGSGRGSKLVRGRFSWRAVLSSKETRHECAKISFVVFTG
jgi:hypothetical protein